MQSQLFTFILTFICGLSFAQQLDYRSGGRVYNSDKQKLSPTEVRELFKDKPEILHFYNKGRSKKTIGNVLLIGGGALLATDLMIGLSSDTKYPTVLTYVGMAATIIAIPVKIGFSKNVRRSVGYYNKQVAYKERVDQNKYEICAYSDGMGLKFTF